MTDQLPDPGVPALLRHLSDLLGETTILVYSPPPAALGSRWRVWGGSPYATKHTGGGEWGAGETPYAALQAAFERAVRSTFDGRIGAHEADRMARVVRDDGSTAAYVDPANPPVLVPKEALTGTVQTSGGGVVTVLVDRDAESYPAGGARVVLAVEPAP